MSNCHINYTQTYFRVQFSTDICYQTVYKLVDDMIDSKVRCCQSSFLACDDDVLFFKPGRITYKFCY